VEKQEGAPCPLGFPAQCLQSNQYRELNESGQVLETNVNYPVLPQTSLYHGTCIKTVDQIFMISYLLFSGPGVHCRCDAQILCPIARPGWWWRAPAGGDTIHILVTKEIGWVYRYDWETITTDPGGPRISKSFRFKTPEKDLQCPNHSEEKEYTLEFEYGRKDDDRPPSAKPKGFAMSVDELTISHIVFGGGFLAAVLFSDPVAH
jgi:hypothetical protein